MSLPSSFSGQPGTTLLHIYRNACIHFKKVIKTSKDVELLESEMNSFLDLSKQMNWHHEKQATYHADPAEKAIKKIETEFKRYIEALRSKPTEAIPTDLLESFEGIESLIETQQVD